jgi:proline dehydrogenase
MDINMLPPVNFEDTQTAFAAKSNWQLRKSYQLFKLFSSETLVSLGARLTPLALKFHLPISPFIKHTVYEQFCGGETLKECEVTIEQLGNSNIKTILDYGIEGKATEQEYEATCQHKLDTIRFAKNKKNVTVMSAKVTGLGRFELLEKIHAGKKLLASEEKEYTKLKERLHKISKACKDADIQIYWDAEETWIQQPIDDLIDELMQHYNTEKAIVFNTIQLYCKNRLAYLMEAHQQAAKKGYVYGAKLVRGAYMEKERERAKKMRYPSPIHENKQAVDRDYNAAIEYSLKNLDTLSFCCASHNEYSNQYLAKRIDEKDIPRNHAHITFGQLFGMGENLTFNLGAANYNALKLIPYGPVKDVIPYLLRRAQENSSVGGQVSRELMLLKKELDRRHK